MRQHVWVGDDEPQRWMRNGSYLVSRRIRMRIEAWDRDTLGDQEQVIGRFKQSGAPLTGAHEFDTADLSAKRADGTPVIGVDAHIRLAAASQNNGIRLLRRGYSFADGIDPTTSELDAGLFFLAFQRDPHRQFAALQRRLGSEDSLNEYILHTTSGALRDPAGNAPGRLRRQRAVRLAPQVRACAARSAARRTRARGTARSRARGRPDGSRPRRGLDRDRAGHRRRSARRRPADGARSACPAAPRAGTDR